jgi:hypothetical protein
MTSSTSDVPAQSSPASSVVAEPVAAAPGWAWRRAALLLSGAAQLITISAVLGVDPPAASWPRLLLAIAPAPLAAAAALAPARWRLAVVAVACAVLVAGITGGWLPTGLLFIPALIAMAGTGITVWHDRS